MKMEHKAKIRDIILISVGGILFATLIAVVSIYVAAPLLHNARDDRPESAAQASVPSSEPGESDSASSERASSKPASSRPASSAPASREEAPASEPVSSEETSSEESSAEETGRSNVWVQSGLTGQQRDLTAEEAETAIALFRAVQYSPAGETGDSSFSGSFVISSTTGQVDNVGIVTRSQWTVNGTLCDITSGGEAFLNYLDSLDVFSGTLSQLEP